MKNIFMEGRRVGEDCPVLIVAELSSNHLQNFKRAVQLIKAAKKAGADAVKLQTFRPESLTLDEDNKFFKIQQGTLWDGKTFYQLYKDAYTPLEWQPKLKKIAEDLGLICFSTPFDKAAVDFLEAIQVSAYKVSSFEITDIGLIEYIASKGKPVLLSTGIATWDDICEAIAACRRMKNDQIAVLKCTSLYPTPFEDVHLRALPELKAKLDCVVGISDHTQGISVAVASVAMGARIIEKHFILERKSKALDAKFSLEPKEFKAMVKAVREVEKALGDPDIHLSERLKTSRQISRSLFVVEDVREGEAFTEKNIRSIRPGFGLPPKYLRDILGKKATKDIKRGTPLSWDLVER